jgi:RNA recognition motif-containing protein
LKALRFYFCLRKRSVSVEKKLYVGNISFKASEGDIRELFARSGNVESVTIITDSHTGNPKGFGFVEMASEEDARKAMTELNGTTFMERILSVAEAKPQQPRERRGFSGGGRGGFGGGGRGRGRGR